MAAMDCPTHREEYRKHYVAYKTQTNFVDVAPQKRRLWLMRDMRFDELSDPRGLVADITNFGLWGNGDVQVELDNERQIPYTMELDHQAFAAKQLGGGVASKGTRLRPSGARSLGTDRWSDASRRPRAIFLS